MAETEELILTEDEKKIILLLRLWKSARENSQDLTSDQVRISVTENLGLGERLGG